MACSDASIDNCQVLYIESFIKDTVNEKKKIVHIVMKLEKKTNCFKMLFGAW